MYRRPFSMTFILTLVVLVYLSVPTRGFKLLPPPPRGKQACIQRTDRQYPVHSPTLLFNQESEDESWEADDGESTQALDGLEKAWRYAKKPLLSIGSKGATMAHGNSLRQLLASHTIVKVKVNTRRFGGSLEEAFQHLKSLAEDSGAPEGIEMIQARDTEKTILFGNPGTMQRIRDGSFPPLPPPPRDNVGDEQ